MNPCTRVVHVLLAAGLAAALVLLAGSVAPAATGTAPASPVTAASTGRRVVRVYYFHATRRCASCMKIEALSAEAIQSGFARELQSGTLEWRAVNLDEPANRHFVQDYKLYTKSVIVADLVNGQQARWKNLPRIWELLHDETAFRQYVQQEVRAYLEKPS